MCYRYIFELKYYVASTKIFFSLFYQHRIIAPKLSWSKNKTLWTFIKSRVYTSYYRIYTFVHCAMRIWRILHALNIQSSIVFFSAGTPNPLTILDVNHICQLSSRTILYKYPAESNAGINRIYRREARYSYTDPNVVFIGVYYPELLYEQETGYPTTLLHCSVGRDRSFLHSIVKLHNISDSMIKFSTTHWYYSLRVILPCSSISDTILYNAVDHRHSTYGRRLFESGNICNFKVMIVAAYFRVIAVGL